VFAPRWAGGQSLGWSLPNWLLDAGCLALSFAAVYLALTLIGLVGIGWVAVALVVVEDRRRAVPSQ
jgi:hypothetical protein